MDEEETGAGLSGDSFIFKDRLQMEPSGDDVRPSRKPKPKVKSQTVSGIALPGLAEMLNKNNASKADVVSAAFWQSHFSKETLLIFFAHNLKHQQGNAWSAKQQRCLLPG